MTRARRLLVRVDATPTIGMGHVVRTANLIAAMADPPEIVVAGEGEALPIYFPTATMVAPNRETFASLAAKYQPDAVLVDLPVSSGDILAAPRSEGVPLIVIDDWGGPIQADLIISAALRNRPDDYPAVAPEHVLCGPRYCLVRPIFGQSAWQRPDDASVAVVAGGGERAQEWLRLLTDPHLDRTAWGTVTVTVGPTFRGIDELSGRCAAIGATLQVGISAETLAGTFARAGAALVTGGMTMYEALAVGVPTVVFPQLRNLVDEAEWVAGLGCIRNLGFDGGMDAHEVSAAVTRLLTDRALAKDMSVRGRQLIDGQGMSRAAQAISGLLDATRRPST